MDANSSYQESKGDYDQSSPTFPNFLMPQPIRILKCNSMSSKEDNNNLEFSHSNLCSSRRYFYSFQESSQGSGLCFEDKQKLRTKLQRLKESLKNLSQQNKVLRDKLVNEADSRLKFTKNVQIIFNHLMKQNNQLRNKNKKLEDLNHSLQSVTNQLKYSNSSYAIHDSQTYTDQIPSSSRNSKMTQYFNKNLNNKSKRFQNRFEEPVSQQLSTKTASLASKNINNHEDCCSAVNNVSDSYRHKNFYKGSQYHQKTKILSPRKTIQILEMMSPQEQQKIELRDYLSNNIEKIRLKLSTLKKKIDKDMRC